MRGVNLSIQIETFVVFSEHFGFFHDNFIDNTAAECAIDNNFNEYVPGACLVLQ